MRRWRWLCGVAAIGLMLGGAPALALTQEQAQALQTAAATGGETLRNQVRSIVSEELAKGRDFDTVVCEVMTSIGAQPVSAEVAADLAWTAVEGAVQAAVNAGMDETTAAEAAMYAAVSGCARTDNAFITALYQRAGASPNAALRTGAANAAARTGNPTVIGAAQGAGLPVPGAEAPGVPGVPGGPGAAAQALAARPFVPVGGGGGGVSSPERPASPAD